MGFYDELHQDHIVSILITYMRGLIANFAAQDLTLTYQILFPELMTMLNSIESASITMENARRIAVFHSYLQDLVYGIV